MNKTTYRVKGMTCEHCVASVSAELAKLADVTDVSIDLNSAEAEVTSEGRLETEAVRAAVEEAGYELVD